MSLQYVANYRGWENGTEVDTYDFRIESAASGSVETLTTGSGTTTAQNLPSGLTNLFSMDSHQSFDALVFTQGRDQALQEVFSGVFTPPSGGRQIAGVFSVLGPAGDGCGCEGWQAVEAAFLLDTSTYYLKSA